MSKDTGITHLNPIRLHVKGEGSLRVTIFDDGEIRNVLKSTTLSEITNKANNIKCNFQSEQICFDIRVLAIDEWFEVSGMWPFVKLVATSHPG